MNKKHHPLFTTREESVLHRIQAALNPPERGSGKTPIRLGIGDDAALFRPRPGHETVLTCDWFLEGTHFLAGLHPPEAVGWKCLARAASDLAAMGAAPRCFLLSLALPSEKGGNWLAGFLRGLRQASRALNCPAAGGDTTRNDAVLINVTVIGECKRGEAVLRSGAQPGDAVFVTGRLGEAELGLHSFKTQKLRYALRDKNVQKHLRPQPRLALSAWLAGHRLATSMMDLSDGLSTDLARLCSASGGGARIEAAKIPCARSAKQKARSDASLLNLALHGGDDYELLFTVALKNLARIPARIGGVPVSRIGEITSDRGIQLIQSDGTRATLRAQGWDPFQK